MAAGPASRLGSIEPGEKTGLRLSPHLAPSMYNMYMYMYMWRERTRAEMMSLVVALSRYMC